jgi:outer membrane protein TolC
MADLRKAKININLSKADQQLQAAEALHKAAAAYFNWKRQYAEAELYQNFYEVAKFRRQGIITLITLGDKPAIDSIEAGITEKSRLLSLEEAKLKLIKARLELSNFLWSGNTPIELTEAAIPEQEVVENVGTVLKTDRLEFSVEQHPKITMLESKAAILNVERRLKANYLLPKIDLGYSYLSERWEINGDPQQNYKVTASVGFPLFLREERGALRLAKIKLQDAQLGISLEKVALSNKVSAVRNEIESLNRQKKLATDVVKDNKTMVEAEERMFNLGESSLFLINTRESNLIVARLSEIGLENRFLLAHAELFRVLAGN